MEEELREKVEWDGRREFYPALGKLPHLAFLRNSPETWGLDKLIC